jgi:formylglycine-generating enzyme required for sulfatase activity
MVQLPEGYCIDSTEVTRAQYAAWLATNPNPSSPAQILECASNNSYAPGCDWPYDGTRSDYPVVCVDWCDAYACCQAVGKRLCGKIGGGANAWGDSANASLSQWYNACVSNEADSTYPYGDTYEPHFCNGEDHGVRVPVAVQSMPFCQSPVPGYEGVYDLSGNVLEWEDSCDGGSCRLRGGYYLGGAGFGDRLSCGAGNGASRNYVNPSIGFRCCSSP